ncbi:MAG TPA: twin-arginine translocation signal domain-containing protein, partial [Dongiaceae bacterium]|nr:twin-arginine translocation signal domain-containing protein [Dongiaceae bacterium]
MTITRRELLAGAGLAIGAAALGALRPGGARAATARRIALTMDDPQHQATPLLEPAERDAKIRAALRAAKVQAALFVTGKRVDDRAGRRLL